MHSGVAESWMQEFYSRRFTSAASLSDAVRDTRLEMLRLARLEGDTHPSAWAGFLALGALE